MSQDIKNALDRSSVSNTSGSVYGCTCLAEILKIRGSSLGKFGFFTWQFPLGNQFYVHMNFCEKSLGMSNLSRKTCSLGKFLLNKYSPCLSSVIGCTCLGKILKLRRTSLGRVGIFTWLPSDVFKYI